MNYFKNYVGELGRRWVDLRLRMVEVRCQMTDVGEWEGGRLKEGVDDVR
ncbi:hypothetical protein [Aquiflexum sp.]